MRRPNLPYAALLVSMLASWPPCLAAAITPGVLIDWEAKTEIGDVTTPTIWELQTGGSLTNQLQLEGYTNYPTLLTSGDAGFSTSYPGITAAFDLNPSSSDGFRSANAAGSGNNFGNLDGDPTNNSATWEIWVKPDSLAGGQQVIWEIGGSGDGSGIYLDDSSLFFWSKDGSVRVEAPSVSLTGDDIGDFIQVVAGIDLANDKTFLYVNGTLTNPGGTSAGGTFNDWAGTDGGSGDGIGVKAGNSYGSSVSGDLDSYGRFDGQIAIVRLYDSLLTDSQVLDNYNAVVPEPATLFLIMAAGLPAVLKRRRSRS